MKKRMVTRRIVFTKLTFLALNIETCETSTETVVLAGTYSKEKEKDVERIEKLLSTPISRVVQVQFTEPLEKIYGMTEEDFLINAKELDEKRNFKTEN